MWEIHPSMHPSNQTLFSTYCVQRITLSTEDKSVNKITTVPIHMGLLTWGSDMHWTSSNSCGVCHWGKVQGVTGNIYREKWPRLGYLGRTTLRKWCLSWDTKGKIQENSVEGKVPVVFCFGAKLKANEATKTMTSPGHLWTSSVSSA